MAESITIKALQDASLDAKSLEEVVNGNDAKQVTTRKGETYPSVKKAIKTMFENGGLPATPFATKALMTASALIDGDYAMVTDDMANNGLYVKTAGTWVKSEYDPLTQAKVDATTKAEAAKADAVVDSNTYTDNALSKVAVVNTDETYSHVFTDKDDKLLAFFDGKGNFDFNPTDAVVERLSDVVKNNDDDFIYLVLDAENRIVDGVDKFGNNVVESEDTNAAELPLRTPLKDMNSTISIKSLDRIIKKMDIKTVAKGRSTDPDIIVNGDGLTHPKMVYVPQGWNGYMYWLAATPTFGVVGGQYVYENPHVWASNDLITWVEPTGAPIDLPEEGNGSYWSDTHLVLDDDGWMYCIYRGSNMSFGQQTIVAKKSRDGVNWSERIMIYNSNDGISNGSVSPAIFKDGAKWQLFDIMESARSFVFPTDNDNGRGVFRRSADLLTGKYQDYDANQKVNYINPHWGTTKYPWHIDAIVVGNMHIHLLAAGLNGQSYSHELYLAYSGDGWNFKTLPKLYIDADNAYRSSISLKEAKKNNLYFDVVVARTSGQFDLFELNLEIN